MLPIMDTAHATVTAVNKNCKILRICDSWTKQWWKYVNGLLKWIIKNNNIFAKDKFRCSYKKVLWKYGAYSWENTHAKVSHKAAQQLYWNHTSARKLLSKLAVYSQSTLP